MPLIALKNIEPKEIVPGYSARFIHTGNMTLSYLDVKEGSILKEHAHFHEQVAHVLEGKFQLTVNGEAIVIEPGQVVLIPSNVKHWGLALTDCKLLDVFYPEREDYKL